MTSTERQRMYQTAVRQLQNDAEPQPAVSLLREAESFLSRPERLERAFGHRCGICHDPDSDPTFDGADLIVCDICGAEWR